MAVMRCAGCGTRMPLAFRPVMADSRHGCCSISCARKFADDELRRLEHYLKQIHQRTRGRARELARRALYTNLSP